MTQKKIIVSCSPQQTQAYQAHLDLAIAACICLLHLKTYLMPTLSDYIFLGELGLDGRLKPVKHLISLLVASKRSGHRGVVLPEVHAAEVSQLQSLPHSPLKDLDYIFIDHLTSLLRWFQTGIHQNKDCPASSLNKVSDQLTFDDMYLSDSLEEIACLAASGGHSLILFGTPGTGKSMFAGRLPSILPGLVTNYQLASLQMHQLAQSSEVEPLLWGRPPFRSPHHTASTAAILGTPELPGDLPLAHGGVLFLDELPEFRRDLIESLREPLETGEIRVSRAQKKTIWPCRALFVAAANLCPCGWLGSKKKLCSCSLQAIQKYQAKLSGPLLDRIDMHIELPEPKDVISVMISKRGLSTESLKERVLSAKQFASQRHHDLQIDSNSQIAAQDILEVCGLKDNDVMLKQLKDKVPTFRSMVKVLRVARSLADLYQEDKVLPQRMTVAMGYCTRDLKNLT